ncbi:MAG: 2TM domain-containing protein [Betaproteobacteria bacterium]
MWPSRGRGPGSRARPSRIEPAGRATAAERAFLLHRLAFGTGVALLSLANWLSGLPWWSFWPIAAWSTIFGVHYLIHKARSTDERWVEERVADLHSKSYDAGHIDSIATRYGDKDENAGRK